MNEREARIIRQKFYRIGKPSEEDIFLFTEAMDLLIRKNKDPNDMMDLGGFYYENKYFDLALKYYEMAAEYKLPFAFDCLGYIWYYGRTGRRDFEKAFRYYSLAKDAGIAEAAVKVADMYKNGYYVDRDPGKYREIIEELYPKVRGARSLNDPLPEVFTRLAMIRKEEGRINEAVRLLLQAKDFQAQRLKYSNFFGGINIMKWLIDDLYEMIEFDTGDFDLFDCMWLLRGPAVIRFRHDGMELEIRAEEEENGEFAIRWQDGIYADRDEFYAKAMLGDRRLMSLYDELYGFKTVQSSKL